MNEPKFLIWSEEHGAWWRAASYDGTTWGYCRSIVEAGRYTEAAANRIVVKANQEIFPGEGFNPGRKFNEMAIPDPLA